MPFFVAGQFGKPSANIGDVTLEARVGAATWWEPSGDGADPKERRKLTTAERDRFIAAFAQLNNQGLGRFQDFRDMHRTDLSLDQAHRAAGFLPWHRAYLLDLERELQAIDPSVALPYWRFDQAAPSLFAPDFLGASNTLGTVTFSPSNPLRFWVTDGVPGIVRRPLFNPAQAPGGLRTEAQTLAIGTAYSAVSHDGGQPARPRTHHVRRLDSDPLTAPRDPLFFLLHCNVDRLWAKWQRQNLASIRSVAASYQSGTNPVGHNLNDSIWPGTDHHAAASTDCAGRSVGPVAVYGRAGSPTARPQLPGLSGVDHPGGTDGFDYDDTPFV